MSSLKFHPLKIKDIRSETSDCISVSFDIPETLRDTFHFLPGQYLTLRTPVNGEEVRRSYSICSSHRDNELRVAIKKVDNGKFSTYAHEYLKKGDTLDVMPPMGKFTPHKTDKSHQQYLAIAAGSGITPVMSIMKTLLEEDTSAGFTLVYGNRSRTSIIFRDAIEGLKNKYMQRLSVYHVLSREQMDIPLFTGRINAQKCAEFCGSLIDINTIDEAFICGPEEMILSVREQLIASGITSDKVHIELFTSPDQPKAVHEQWVAAHQGSDELMSKVSITLDGATFEIDVPYNGLSILDAALQKGADLPFACKGGVCCTCRARVMEGVVEMEVNYALEAYETQKGYILTCQSHPRSEKVIVDFDQR